MLLAFGVQLEAGIEWPAVEVLAISLMHSNLISSKDAKTLSSLPCFCFPTKNRQVLKQAFPKILNFWVWFNLVSLSKSFHLPKSSSSASHTMGWSFFDFSFSTSDFNKRRPIPSTILSHVWFVASNATRITGVMSLTEMTVLVHARRKSSPRWTPCPYSLEKTDRKLMRLPPPSGL